MLKSIIPFILVILTSCIPYPKTFTTDLGFEGQLINQKNEPIAHTDIIVNLSNFGQESKLQLTTDSLGHFKSETKEEVFWLIPNSGPVPPPPHLVKSISVFSKTYEINIENKVYKKGYYQLGQIKVTKEKN